MSLKFYNTITHTGDEFHEIEKGKVRIRDQWQIRICHMLTGRLERNSHNLTDSDYQPIDYKGRRIYRMYNTAWKTAWRKAGLPTDPKFCRGPHNLKHTFGRRLRAVGVPLETRKVLLHHTTGDITIHYSPADIQELLDAVAKLSEMRPVTLLKKVVG